MQFKKLVGGVFAGALALSLSVSSAAAAGTVLVSGDTAAGENQPGWMFNRDVSTSTPFAFNPGNASVGTGSLYVQPIGANASDKFIGENFLNKSISEVNSISYDFKIGAGGTDTSEEQFYMNVYANFGVSPDDKFYDCRYNVVPTVGSTAGFTTVTFDPTLSYPVTKRGDSPFNCPSNPSGMDSLSPNSTIRMFALNVGDTTASDAGIDGYLDKVVVNTDSDVTTYDFDPAVTPTPTMTPEPTPTVPPMPTDKDDCKKGGWMAFLFKNQGQCVSSMVKNSHANK